MYLRFHDLTIRNAVADDAALLAAWWNDGAVMAHAGFPNGLGTTAEAVAASLQEDSDSTRRRLIIERDGSPIGEMNYRDAGGGAADIGIKICDFSQQEKGLGRIFLSMLIASLFDELGYKKIVLDTNLKNTRAQHVYEKLGFTKLRTLENSWQDQLGNWQSTVEYELHPANFVSFVE